MGVSCCSLLVGLRYLLFFLLVGPRHPAGRYDVSDQEGPGKRIRRRLLCEESGGVWGVGGSVSLPFLTPPALSCPVDITPLPSGKAAAGAGRNADDAADLRHSLTLFGFLFTQAPSGRPSPPWRLTTRAVSFLWGPISIPAGWLLTPPRPDPPPSVQTLSRRTSPTRSTTRATTAVRLVDD